MKKKYSCFMRNSSINIVIIFITIVLVSISASLFVYIIQSQKPKQAVNVKANSNNASVNSSSMGEASSTLEAPSTLAENKNQVLNQWQLILVNPTTKMPENYKYQIKRAFGIEMDDRIIKPYTEMNQAAAKAGVTLWVSSGYRSTQIQQKLFNNEIKGNLNKGLSSSQAIDKAALAVARPGYSEHNTGLALDLNGVRQSFDTEKGFAWLQIHAQEYGFVLRYPKDKEEITKIMYEPWHYRYVGTEHAKKMSELNMCLEEYVEYLKKKN